MATQIALTKYGYNHRRSTLGSIFSATVNTAAKTLISMTANAKLETPGKWKVMDHLRFMFMIMTWFAVWVLRVVKDYLPLGTPLSFPTSLLEGFSPGAGAFDIVQATPSSSSASASLELILLEGSAMAMPPDKALGRALSHVLVMVNDVPATSRKYQFAMAMADKMVDENTRDGNVELLEINRYALASAFARTSALLHRSLESSSRSTSDQLRAWSTRILSSLPFGYVVAPFVVHGIGAVLSLASGASCSSQKEQQVVLGGGRIRERVDDVAAEKHAQELLWIVDKMRRCGAVDEALIQWSLANGLASLAHNANPRVQGFILKISALLIEDLSGVNMELVPTQVTFRLLVLWLPLFCHAENGISYPVLTHYEKLQVERIMDGLISTLPAMDQQLILTNWLQDFTISASEWPNLWYSYERWCRCTRNLVAENIQYWRTKLIHQKSFITDVFYLLFFSMLM